MKNQIVTYLFLGFFHFAFSQDFKTDFDKVNENIAGANSCHIVSQITMYSSKKNLAKVHTFKAELIRSGDKYKSIMDEVEIIANEDFVVMIDKEEKIVQVEKNPELKKSEKKFLQEFNELDSSFNQASSTSILFNNESEICYSMKLSKGMINSVTVTILKSNYTLKKIEYEYNTNYYPTGNYVVIEYTKFNLNPEIDNHQFSAEDVVRKKGNIFLLSEKYKEYELLDLYQQTAKQY